MSKKVPSSQPNPFEPAKQKKNQPPSIKYCAWEVLKDKPNGLVLSNLVKEIEDRELRHFSRKKSSIPVVARELRKQKEYFTHDKEKNSWCIKASQLVDSEETEDDESILSSSKKSKYKKASTSITEKKKMSPLKTIKQEKIKDDEETVEELRKKSEGEGGLKEREGGIVEKIEASSSPSSPHKRKLKRSPSPRSRKKAKGIELVGLPVKVWWAGEQQYFPGKISSYNKEKDRYDISYEDGDIDIDLEFRKYDIEMKGAEMEWIRIDEHNMDDSEVEEGNTKEDDGGDDKKESGDDKKTEVAIAESGKIEKQPSDEGEKKSQE